MTTTLITKSIATITIASAALLGLVGVASATDQPNSTDGDGRSLEITDASDGFGKAQNRRVEVKLSK